MPKLFAVLMLTSLLFSSSWAQQPAAKQRRVPPSADHYAAQAKYLEQLKLSLQKGTSFAVFEPNNEKLWGNVRQTVQNYLFNEWKNGALLGDKPEQAYFVKCDRTTMSQNDLDNGRLIVLVGVAQVRPAEFVTFRIVQLTANHGQAGKRPVKKN